MGGRHSRPAAAPVYPEYDPLFKSIGCIGLTRNDYSSEQRLLKAPFYTVKIVEKTYARLLARIIGAIKDVGQSTELVGPIYVLAAFDVETKDRECHLLFPNIDKEKKKWSKTYQLGIYHRWVYRLLFSKLYKASVKYSSCKIRDPVSRNFNRSTGEVYDVKPGDPATFMYGCKTQQTTRCMLNDSAHKEMGIYDPKKKPVHYPSVYFRAYEINQTDDRISSSISNPNTPNTPNSLNRNILPMGFDMLSGCNNVLVSPNNQYIFALSSRRLGLYEGTYEGFCKGQRRTIFEKRIRGGFNTRAVIEENILNIYSQGNPQSDEQVIHKMTIAPEDISMPISLVLESDGSLNVVDFNNTSHLLISKTGIINTRMTNSSSMSQVGNNMGGWDEGDYDEIADFRERLLDLWAYLRSVRQYTGEIAQIDVQQVTVPPIVYEELPPYDENADYFNRMSSWLAYLRQNGKISSKALAEIAASLAPPPITTSTSSSQSQQQAQAQTNTEKTDDLSEPIQMTPEEIDAQEKAEAEAKKKLQEEMQAQQDAIADGIDLQETELPPPANIPMPSAPGSQQPQDINATAEQASSSQRQSTSTQRSLSFMNTQASKTDVSDTNGGYDEISDFRNRLQALHARLSPFPSSSPSPSPQDVQSPQPPMKYETLPEYDDIANFKQRLNNLKAILH